MSWRESVISLPLFLVALCLGWASYALGKDAAPERKAKSAEQELPPMESRAQPRIIRVTPNATQVPRYGMCELTVDLTASYDNPFDPDQADLTAEFTTPSGKKVIVAGFFYQPYKNRNEGDDAKSPILDADGPPRWKVRFAPVETGRHTYVVRLKNRFDEVKGDVASSPGSFTAVASDAPGFIRVSKTNDHYFEFDNGKPFFAVGQNLQNDWPIYRHSRLLAEGGGNAARVWTFCHWTWLEWTFRGGSKWAGPGHWMRSYAGAGKYNQRVAWIADHHLEQWRRDGIFVMLCIGNATGNGEVSISGKDKYDSWGGHPYNVANGGFLDDPKKFWTDERARRLYKQRLRYMTARWGYSPAVWAWEFWNELGGARPEIADWHKEMAQYLRDADPNRHLITTSTWEGNPDKFAAIWDLPQMDFTQCHHYGALPPMMPEIAEFLRRWPKPHIFGEGGGSPYHEEGAKDPTKAPIVDPDSIEFHDSLWAPVVLGAAGTTLPWWWRDRVEPLTLFFHYRAVADFVRDVPWADRRWRPLQVQALALTGEAPPKKFSPVLVAPFGADWGSKPMHNRFRVGPDGAVSDPEHFAGELFGNGPARREWRNPQTIEVSYPEPGKFIVHVSKPLHSILEIRLDGNLVLREAFPTGPDEPFRKDLAVDVPAGKHELGLDNAGSDLVRFGYIILTNYRDAVRYPDLDVFGRQTDDLAVLWIHNRLNQWPYKAAGLDAPPVGPALATLVGLKDGSYRVEWWDTYKGQVTKTEEAQAQGGTLRLPLPVLQTDVACKIKPAH